MPDPSHLDAVLALADTVFGAGTTNDQPASPALGKLWGQARTAAGQVLEVRIGWIEGRQYLQFLERPGAGHKCTSILVPADVLGTITEHLASLCRHERGSR